jgi:hypothetical protein
MLCFVPKVLYLRLKRLTLKKQNPTKYDLLKSLRKEFSSEGYSYKSLIEKKAIFVHIPKCAGISVNEAIFSTKAGGHTSLNDYCVVFSPQELNDYFKFTIVRNPWDRLVSAYTFLQKGGFNDSDKNWYHENLSKFEDFNDFVKCWVTPENIKTWKHFRLQTDFLLEKRNRINVDFVGFFENIDNDFDFIAKRLNIINKLKPKNITGREGSYRDFYNTETINIVRDVYEKDISYLGYKFDNSNIHEMIENRNTDNVHI